MTNHPNRSKQIIIKDNGQGAEASKGGVRLGDILFQGPASPGKASAYHVRVLRAYPEGWPNASAEWRQAAARNGWYNWVERIGQAPTLRDAKEMLRDGIRKVEADGNAPTRNNKPADLRREF